MADHQHHHHLHRPHRISVPPRPTNPTTFPVTPKTSRAYPPFPYPPSSTPTPTPSKHRLSSLNSRNSFYDNNNNGKSSLSFLFLLLFSLRSLYSLLPFLRSSPSFSLFPFSFLVSLLSFLLTLLFSSFSKLSTSYSKDPFYQKQNQPIFSLTSITQSQHRILVAKSILLAVVFLLRFQALRYCGTAAMILAELSGNVSARFVTERRNRKSFDWSQLSKVRGFLALFSGLFLLSMSWDRIECFPLSAKFMGFSVFPKDKCLRIWPMLLPFLSGFLGCYERVSMNWGTVRQLGSKRVRLISLFFTTVVLFIPAVVSVFMIEAGGDGVSFGNLCWPLVNTVVFGVLLMENFSDEKLVVTKDFQREFWVTFACTIVLELFYFPELSLWGLLLCGLLFYIAVRELDPFVSDNLELGMDSSESLSTLIMKPIRHILSERKSRKIALFLLINTGYMVVEFVAGFMSNSLGLISDACHMLFDCAALAIGLYASYISRLPANNQFNFGRGRFEILSGYVNAVFLVLVGSLIVLESIERILDPQEISTNSLLVVSVGGLLVNVVGLIFFHEEHHHAHGGSGSCSHSHSHHHQHSHHYTGLDQVSCANQEANMVSHRSSENICSSGGGHDEHNLYSHSGSSDVPTNHHHQPDHSSHTHNHDHQSQNHQHEFHDHGHAHQHDSHNHDHAYRHDSHDHAHRHSSHDHAHRHSSHDHTHHHDSHKHRHLNSHEQASQNVHHGHCCQQDNHTHHFQAGHNVHRSLPHGSSTYDNSFEKHGVAEPQAQRATFDPKTVESHKHHHRHIDHNMEGIFLHVLADTMGSVGVVISTLLIKYKGWLVSDPACSIFISILIISSVIPLLRNSAEILLQRIPRAHEQDLREALSGIWKMNGVRGVQNLHVWSLTNTDVVGTLHLHVSTETDKASTKAQVSHILHDAGIKDLTLQVECVR